MTKDSLHVEKAVSDRYSKASKEREAALCCPVDYNREFLKIIPQEVIDRDYGCGDPSQYVREGETVLDLGSGGGKICFIAAQVVGAKGKIIGVDINDDMLSLARDSAMVVGERLGYHNVEFRRGQIQDLKLDRELLGEWLQTNPVTSESDLKVMETQAELLKKEQSMIPDNSIDVVVSNCVLNLVDTNKKDEMFREIFRVLKPGGRAVISDIVSDEAIPVKMQNDAELWSGCLSGAYEEQPFLEAFENVGFHGVLMDKRDDTPWQTIEGIEFRSVTVLAWKPEETAKDMDHNEAVVYKGPFAAISDDDGNTYLRGERIAVSHRTYDMLSNEPYAEHFFKVPPINSISSCNAKQFDSKREIPIKSARETKGKDYTLTNDSSSNSSGCC